MHKRYYRNQDIIQKNQAAEVRIVTFTFNPFQENTYLLIAPDLSCAIVDPGCYGSEECEQLAAYIEANSLAPKRLLHTHCHLDHMLGNRFVCERYSLTPEHHPLEAVILESAVISGSRFGLPVEASPSGKPSLTENSIVTINDIILEVIHAPGHSPGSVCFYHPESGQLIGGDVLFRESIGRTDLPGGHHQTLLDSIRERLFTLPPETIVYPGHGPTTTIGFEISHNPFLQ
jgi:glyoxylase-like metal-dependent hydrolase (beta-lactamase superfamily II)